MSADGGAAWPGRVRLGAIGLIVAAPALLIAALPFDQLLDQLGSWIEGLGLWGPLIFAGVYAVWAVLLLPGSALTLAGGAIFGLGTGTAAVLSGATIGAALSFLIARYVARERVAAMARSNPKFGAIDGAIGKGGWKIVAMLRLSPVMPFNLQNYLYGVTAIPFWPCVLTSAIFMAPGTFLYVYLGRLAGQGLAAASGQDSGRTPQEWALLAVGLAATIAVTVYVSRLATKALNEHTLIEQQPSEPTPARRATSAAAAIITAAVAVVVFAAALYAYIEREALQHLVGRPSVESIEAYQRSSGGPDVDHSLLDEVLAAHVRDGRVDYRALAADSSQLDAYIASLAEAPFAEMGRDQKLALLINAYNAFTLRLILDHYPLGSINDIPDQERWKAKRWRLAGETVSLDQIEHERIRPKFAEPRIHFALVCASVGCPKLRGEAYVAERLEEQLEDQARTIHGDSRWFSFDADAKTVRLTQLYRWYGGDFKQQAGSVPAFAAQFSPALKKALDEGEKVDLRWIDYDWSLNGR